jgi:hypothetical protein
MLELRRILGAAAVLAILPSGADAAPRLTPKQCNAAHEEAQTLKSEKKPHAAREKLVVCSRSECPVVLRKECAEQLALVDRDAPTVALEARDDGGNDTTAVKVTMDGSAVADRLTGTAIDVEPGEHVFHFERADGKTIDQKVLVVEGEKNRKVVADFSTLVPKPPPKEEPKPQPAHEEKKMSPLVFVAGGVAVLGVASFAFFSLSGKGKEHDLQGSCSPHCTDSDVRPVKTDYLVGDISLVVAVVATAAAVILALPALGSTNVQTASVRRDPPWMPKVKVR